MVLVKFWINDIFYEEDINSELTVFQQCSEKGIDLPCFCYHESLSIAGNCRMCLVEINTSAKLVVSCAMPMSNLLKIYTNNYRISRARENILELLLCNHPLDCPICDQGGECDLQDITLLFGSDKSRFYEYKKRAVFDKDCGLFIKTIMTRCIHCTRCVRFLTELSNTDSLGMLNRGNESEISTYISKFLNEELSGNIIDLCPVGALTSKPYAFTVRPWELNNIESIDVLDSLASNIRVDFLNDKVYRILPLYDKYLNEDWITNKARFSYDVQNFQRILYPTIKNNNTYISISWLKAFFLFFRELINFLKKDSFFFVFCGNFVDINTFKEMKYFFNSIGIDIFLADNIFINSDFRCNYICNYSFLDFEENSELIFLGVNLRVELPIWNIKLKRYVISKNLKINNFGMINDYVNVINYGNLYNEIYELILGKGFFNKPFFSSNVEYCLFSFERLDLKFYSIFLGACFFNHINSIKLYDTIKFFFDKYIMNYVLNIVILNISYLNFFEICGSYNNYKFMLDKVSYFMFFENVDNEIFIKNIEHFFKLKDIFLVYHGAFFDIGAKNANLLFPSTLSYESTSYFLNLEGNVKKTNKVISNYKKFFSCDLFILLLLFKNYIFPTTCSFLSNLKRILLFFDFLNFNWILNKLYEGVISNNKLESRNIYNGFFSNFYFDVDNIFNSNVYNYYKGDSILRNSKLMHLASLNYLQKLKSF